MGATQAFLFHVVAVSLVLACTVVAAYSACVACGAVVAVVAVGTVSVSAYSAASVDALSKDHGFLACCCDSFFGCTDLGDDQTGAVDSSVDRDTLGCNRSAGSTRADTAGTDQLELSKDQLEGQRMNLNGRG